MPEISVSRHVQPRALINIIHPSRIDNRARPDLGLGSSVNADSPSLTTAVAVAELLSAPVEDMVDQVVAADSMDISHLVWVAPTFPAKDIAEELLHY